LHHLAHQNPTQSDQIFQFLHKLENIILQTQHILKNHHPFKKHIQPPFKNPPSNNISLLIHHLPPLTNHLPPLKKHKPHTFYSALRNIPIK
ncbi:hypothetical protein, partial [Staphylococcus epidermidis]|uniref:hypothetical protein n=1 Tax=Staphylococcus epidermidis TaxID=1282 RepID=UPI0037D9B6D0